MCTFVTLDNKSAALAKLFLEPMIALLNITYVGEIAIVIVEWVHRCLFGCLHAMVIQRLLHFLLLHDCPPFGTHGKAKVYFTNINQPFKLVFIFMQFFLLKFIPIWQSLSCTFIRLVAYFDLLFPNHAVK